MLTTACATTDGQITQSPNILAICDMQEGGEPITLVSHHVAFRFQVYTRMELVGPTSCRKVAIRFRDPSLYRPYYRLLAARENKKEYAFVHESVIDGVATYDAEEGRVRIDIDKMVGLPDS